MFRRFRLVSRGPVAMPTTRQGATKQGSRTRPVRTPHGGSDVKALISQGLAHRPAWTNTLPVADPKGRAANTAATVPAPLIALPDNAKGDAAWPTSAAPR